MSSTEKDRILNDQKNTSESKVTSMMMPSIPMPETKPEIKFNKVELYLSIVFFLYISYT